MKKLVLAVSVILISAAVFSQNAKVVSAYNYLRNGQLDKAKQNIDEACVHEQTMGQAKTWFYCGNIYLSLTGTDNEKYKALSENPMQVAYDAYQKALKIDPEIQNESLMPYSPKVGLLILGEQYINKGADFYQQQNFTEAISMFEMSRKISGIFSQKDTIATYYAAICAIQMQDNAKAKSYLEDLTKANIKQGLVYTQLATIYKNEGDSVKAMNTILKGRKLMPNDLNLIIGEINIYLSQGKFTEAQDLLNLAVEKDPNNPSLHFAIGANMDEFGNFEQAEKSYNKAIEIKPDYFDAYYNLGALYVNTAAKVMEDANKLPITETQKYDELKTKADGLLDKAIPALEKARELNQKDKNTLYTLKQLYARKGNLDKIKEIDDILKGL